MKRLLFLLTFAFAFLAERGFAQQKGKDTLQTASGAERVASLKVAFITKRLELTPGEAEKFWPIYNEYQDKRDVVRKQQQENRKKIREHASELSDEECTRLADQEIALRQQDVALQAELHEKLKKVLPPKKIALLYVAEEDFKKELLKILTDDNNPPNPPKGNPK